MFVLLLEFIFADVIDILWVAAVVFGCLALIILSPIHASTFSTVSSTVFLPYLPLYFHRILHRILHCIIQCELIRAHLSIVFWQRHALFHLYLYFYFYYYYHYYNYYYYCHYYYYFPLLQLLLLLLPLLLLLHYSIDTGSTAFLHSALLINFYSTTATTAPVLLVQLVLLPTCH